MADNYTRFSFALPIPKDKNREDVKTWLNALAEFMDSDEGQEEHGSLSFSLEDTYIWVRDGGESGSVAAAVFVAKQFVAKFDIVGGIYFGWAEACSKPRLNEFSGGGVVVAKEGVFYSDSYDCRVDASKRGVELINES